MKKPEEEEKITDECEKINRLSKQSKRANERERDGDRDQSKDIQENIHSHAIVVVIELLGVISSKWQQSVCKR